MELVHSRCCGLDVHKTRVVAFVLVTTPDGEVERHFDVVYRLLRDVTGEKKRHEGASPLRKSLIVAVA